MGSALGWWGAGMMMSMMMMMMMMKKKKGHRYLLGARMLQGAPGLTTRSKDATSNLLIHCQTSQLALLSTEDADPFRHTL